MNEFNQKCCFGVVFMSESMIERETYIRMENLMKSVFTTRDSKISSLSFLVDLSLSLSRDYVKSASDLWCMLEAITSKSAMRLDRFPVAAVCVCIYIC